ncbi:MAG: DNA repair protein RecN [Bacteroidetes bacterium]|nr:DNA repair protein RecN [Bacteroidota bacterium]
MLEKLYIENYALIDLLEIEFHEGFSVITGETGAGKSILLGALSLILGQRADTAVLSDKYRKCIVEGSFLIRDYHLDDFFSSNELDFDDTITLRREISQTGKSRAFINDTPVHLPLMKELGDKLVNVHSQNSINILNDTNFQLAALDNYSGNLPDIKNYHALYARYGQLKAELEELIALQVKSKNEKDYFQFLFDELEVANLQPGEQEDTEDRLAILSHSEEIKTNLYKGSQILSGGESSILNQLSDLLTILQNLSHFNKEISSIADRLKSNQIDLKDINDEISRLNDHIVFDQEEAENLTNRLDLIYRLEKKHSVSSIGDVTRIKQEMEGKLIAVGDLDERIDNQKVLVQQTFEQLLLLASRVSQKRKKAIPGIEKSIIDLLIKLGMPDARLQIEHSITGLPYKDGIDKVRFLFSSNPGSELNEISKIASGGELSRLMLSIKSLISQKNLLPTIIFDEIDSGVSGEIAGKVGSILQKMSEDMQVIVITHLPQIAGKGHSHYWVYKSTGDGTTRSQIKLLTKQERIHEIAKMLSDEKVTESANKTANELLGY